MKHVSDMNPDELEQWLASLKRAEPGAALLRSLQAPAAAPRARILPWLWLVSAAAALLVVLGVYYTPGGRDHASDLPRFAAEGDFADFRESHRLAGIIADKVIVEESGAQKTYAKGDTIGGFVIANITQDAVTLKDRDGKLLTWKLKGGAIEPVKDGGNDGKPGQFVLQGAVIGTDGKPVPGAYLSAFHADGSRDGDHDTGAGDDGRYRIVSTTPVHALRTVHNDLSLTHTGPWKIDATVDFRFDKETPFVLSGTVRDEHGKPLPGITVNAQSDAASRWLGWLGSGVTDKDGRYQLTALREVAYLSAERNYALAIDKPCKDLCVRKRGPWKTDATVDFDFAKDGVFKLTVILVDDDGKPLVAPEKPEIPMMMEDSADPFFTPGIALSLFDDKGRALFENAPYEYAAATFHTNTPVSHILAAGASWRNASGLIIRHDGPWKESAGIDVRYTNKGCFSVYGTVGSDTQGTHTVTVEALDENNRRLNKLATWWGATYQLFSNTPIAALRARCGNLDLRRNGPWNASTQVDLLLESTMAYTLQGTVVDESGEPLRQYSAKVAAYDKHDKKIGDAGVMEGGKYSLTVSSGEEAAYAQVEIMRADIHCGRIRVNGPWQDDATVDIDFKRAGAYTLVVHVVNDENKPTPAVSIETGLDNNTGTVYRTGTGDDGRFVILTNLSVPYLIATNRVAATVRKDGPWNAAGEVTIQFGKDASGFELRVEVVASKDGLGPDAFGIVTTYIKKAGGNLATPGQSLLKNNKINIPCAKPIDGLVVAIYSREYGGRSHWLRVEGPWDKTQDIEIDVTREGKILIDGRITDADGHAIKAELTFTDETGQLTGKAFTNAEGRYELSANLAIATITMKPAAGAIQSLDGPWSESATVDFTVE